MKNLNYILSAMLFLTSLTSFAQSEQVEMADVMRSEGKIYVVVGIIVIILTGLVFLLFMMDKKVKKLQDLLDEKKSQTK